MRIQRELCYIADEYDTLTTSTTESSDKFTTYGYQTGISVLLASNASVTRECCSSRVFQASGIHVMSFLSNMIRDDDIRKKFFAECRVVSGTTAFQEVFERTTKEMTASASSAMKIKVVVPSDGSSSSWRQALPLRGSVVPAKLSALRKPRHPFS